MWCGEEVESSVGMILEFVMIEVSLIIMSKRVKQMLRDPFDELEQKLVEFRCCHSLKLF
jgi:hypothetical protein